MTISSGVAHVYPHGTVGQGARSKSAHQLERPVGNAQFSSSRMVPGNPRSINSHCPMVGDDQSTWNSRGFSLTFHHHLEWKLVWGRDLIWPGDSTNKDFIQKESYCITYQNVLLPWKRTSMSPEKIHGWTFVFPTEIVELFRGHSAFVFGGCFFSHHEDPLWSPR